MMNRVWIAGAAAIAAVAAFPLAQSGQVSAKAAAPKVAVGPASSRAEQTRSQPESPQRGRSRGAGRLSLSDHSEVGLS